MHKFFLFSIFSITIFINTPSFGQGYQQTYRIMFYNVENLFDTLDNKQKRDDDFTPDGAMKWDSMKYRQKLKDIYKVIMAVGQWDVPLVAGFAEVENISVLNDLVTSTPLNKFSYKPILEESGDNRGIDVGLIYRSDKIKYLNHTSVKVFADNSSRHILLFSGIIEDDTLHFLVNHWPSRLSGKEHSEHLRITASDQLIHSVDSIFSSYENPNIIILGDFNDTPEDKSILQLVNHSFKDQSGEINKLTLSLENDVTIGSTVYTDVFTEWYLFDQIILSEHLTSGMNLQILKAPWVLNYSGHPNRTYLGTYYNGGISDHLPVYIDIVVD